MSASPLLQFHLIGDWSPKNVRVKWVASSHRLPETAQPLVEKRWNEVAASGVYLFDGPMCRLERFSADRTGLHLEFSRTSYKTFLGTNLAQPRLADRHGWAVLANPVGVSSALLSADGFVLMGRRNGSVAYYPHRVHPFAGALEPRENLDVFAEVKRELREELSLGDPDLADVRLVCLAEDYALRQPELIFIVRSTLDRQRIESQLDPAEHAAMWAVPVEQRALEDVLTRPGDLTPVAIATLLQLGRTLFGPAWFTDQSAPWT